MDFKAWSVSGCNHMSNSSPTISLDDIRFFAILRRASFHDIISLTKLRVFYQGAGPNSDFKDSLLAIVAQRSQTILHIKREHGTSHFIIHNTTR
jgi:hypothetical protein